MGTKLQAQYAAKYSNGQMVPFQLAGTPVNGASGSFVNRATVGSQLIDTVTGKLYIATAATGSSVTWTLVGAQV
jgi:hypothetical protein